MTVEPLLPTNVLPPTADEPLTSTAAGGAEWSFAGALESAFGAASASFERAERAEHAFTAGRGGLQEMVLQRAQADVALSLASAAASRTAQALSTILGMAV